jgi:FkbM family methyltransferase
MIITDFNVAIAEEDTHIGEWVRQHKRLDIATQMIDTFKQHIQPGTIVIDGGANIGDHTMTYSQLVKENGLVIAVECNRNIINCLKHNTIHMLKNWVIVERALWDKHDIELYFNTIQNVGASHITTCSSNEIVRTTTIDKIMEHPRIRSMDGTVSMIKLDIEGAELHALRGACDTIEKHRPCLLLEVNQSTLQRFNIETKELIKYIVDLGYKVTPTYSSCKLTDPVFDIICTYQ